MNEGELRREGARGVGWNAVTLVANKLAVLVTTLVLVRVLEPDEFGLLGVGLVAIGYLEFVNDLGISAAVIQRAGDERTASVAFWFNLVVGAVMTLAGIAVAPLVADLFNEPRATDVVRLLSLTFILRSLGAIHSARIRKELQFRRRVVPELGKAVVKGVVSITLAFSDFGVWSLVWGQLAGAITASLLYWRAFPWRPAPAWDPRVAGSLLAFGWQITLIGLIGTARKNFDSILVGRWLGSAALGIYTIAFRLPQLVVDSIGLVVAQVAFPVFAKLQDDVQRGAEALTRLLRISALATMPAGVGLFLVADPLVRFAYGSDWAEAIDVLRMLALFMVMQTITRHVGDFYKGTDRARLLSLVSVAKLAIAIPLLIAGARVGLVEVARAQLIAATIVVGPELWIAAKISGAPFRRLVGALIPATRASLVMVAVTLPMAQLVDDWADPLALVVLAALGAASYVATLVVVDRELLREVMELLGRGRGAPVSVPDAAPE